MLPRSYPFSALVGQTALREALLLAAVDPGVGGVLVSGPRGTAKSTAARSLAELLPEGRFVTLPLGATQERLVGSLDLNEALRGGSVTFSPGLLAQAHHGVLYVDEVNLLDDALVDAVLDAAASGVNVVERDGVSHSHAARFVLIGTMNPEEGELRPQLLDRFGLMVELDNCFDVAARQQIVKTRLAFDADPDAFCRAYADEQQAVAQRIREAREALPALAFDDAIHADVSARCIEAGVDGLRADLVMLRAARALAALERAAAITTAHVDRVAPAVLRHRRREEAGGQRDERAASPGSSSAPRGDTAAGAHEEKGRSTESGDVRHGSPPHAAAAQPDAGTPSPGGERDWGYLAPEHTGIANVKGVIPLSVKKR
ncbi:ATP-binding protein [Paraburkholderia kururiensis]|uniref:ATP-binding protein n=1 Tax=Paraburkholderia kururiensis TaxID=984307 RepID=UPI0039A76AA3